ncbi:sensor histidine kinase [Bdellovibrio sp. NC01]|uniref:sensor histidine kinase n=1 Tax=Bdellovibrio sp. NC01 TaxID=2220073 RepID=UPI001156D05C|nr:ATP-binding protein [Bdellovibrio sp. NC01]QDK37726.1 hypothetical protein DOE51_09080 [Bdellovibrio sp. NC01]
MRVLSQSVLNSLALDFHRRSVAASVGFIVVFSLLLFIPIATTPVYIPIHQIAAVCALCASFVRLYIGLKVMKEGMPGLRFRKLHAAVILISTTGLGIVCTLGFWDPLNSDSKIFITSFLISAIMAGSTSSLALNPRVQAYFLFVVGVIPGTVLAFSTHTGELPYNVWTIFIFTFVVYVYGNSKQFYLSMATRYEVEEALQVEKQNLTMALQKVETTQEELLAQTARAEYSAKLASLGEMAGGIAHEINTPLNVILLSVEQQLDLLQDAEINKTLMREAIEKVQSTTNRIAAIVRGLRTFARDGAKDPIEVVPVDTLIETTLSLCLEKFKLNDIELRRPQASHLTVHCRPVQISQVLLNLLNNAFEAIRELPQKWIAIEVRDLGSSVEIRITDSGHGIPEDIHHEIFRPFYTTKEIGKGTGLGLSISRGLIEAHHGKLFIDSTNPNTSFVIQLPH